MRILTVDDVRALNPCYDPAEKVAEDWTGTVIDILRLENVGQQDRIWVVTHYLTDRRNRLFAVWCAREALKLIDKPDPRSVNACDVAERFANSEATEEELVAAGDVAWDVAGAAGGGRAAWVAARAAGDAWAAAWAAAGDAARDAQIKKLIEMIEREGECSPLRSEGEGE